MASAPLVCVAGMHRSGTSMVAQLLDRCGLYLGRRDQIIPPTTSNVDGHWEHQEIVSLNDAILAAMGGAWDLPPELAHGWEKSPLLDPLKARALTLIARFSEQQVRGWKDPRASLTLPFWLELLPKMKVVVCLRDPVEVALSLQRRSYSSLQFGCSLWRRYNEHLLEALHPERAAVVHYDAFFSSGGGELRRLLKFAGIEADDETIEKCVRSIRADLRHNRATSAAGQDASALAGTRELYRTLCELAQWDPAATVAQLAAPTSPAAPEDECDTLRRKLWLAEAALTECQATATGELESLRGALAEERDAAAQVRAILRHTGVTLDEPAAGLLEYEDMLVRIRAAVDAHVPRDAAIAVVSKGDERLVQFAARRALHFSDNADGAYCGHYPADDAEAVAWLEAARNAGADFLLLPAFADWWLRQYPALALQLESSASLVCDTPDACKIFALSGGAASTVIFPLACSRSTSITAAPV